MRNKDKLYEVEIKSKALLREGKKGFVTYFQGGTHKQIISNCKKLYPQYMNPDDKPNVNITPISKEAFEKRKKDNVVYQKQHLIEAKGHVV